MFFIARPRQKRLGGEFLNAGGVSGAPVRQRGASDVDIR
jgi:hypothetical protein